MVSESFGSYDPSIAAAFVEAWEGRKLVAYQCSAGKWTIGVGHTDGVKKGDTCSNGQADAWFVADLALAARGLAPYVNRPVTEGQYIALVSLAFNVGARYVTHSCPKLMRALNAKKDDECAKEFLDICTAADPKTGKRVRVAGLEARRKSEAKLFLGG